MRLALGPVIVLLFTTLSATMGCGGGSSATANGNPTAPALDLDASPGTVTSGTPVTLAWNSERASSVTIAGLGTFPANGSVKLTPTNTTTYQATASGPGGTTSDSAVVTVTSGQAPTILLTAQPTSITVGGSATLTWTTTNATSVSIQGLGSFGANGSTKVSPAATTTYNATAQGPAGTASAQTTVTVSTAGFPAFGHVFLVMEENHNYSSVIGNSAMPYLNSLASQYGLATQYFANTHPSIGNYFELTTGQIITNDDGYTGTVSADNVVRGLLAAGKTWKSYAESLPQTGYTGGDVYPYVKHHNPFTYFTDVVNSQNQLNNLVPFSEFAADLNNNHLAQYSYIVPNMLDDAHDGTLAQADAWLQSNIAPLIASAVFEKDGLLVIVFDESFDNDNQHGGGQVPAIIISPFARQAYRSTTFYQHQSTCRLLMQGMGLTSFPGDCESAGQMGEFF